MNKIFKILIIMLLTYSTLYSQDESMSKYVISSGGGKTSDGTNTISSTISQPVIGQVFHQDLNHYIGFWYNARKMIDSIGTGTVVAIPNSDADIGTTVRIPVLLLESQNLKYSNVSNYKLKIRFNGTILVPSGKMPNCSGLPEYCELEISGTIESEDVLVHLEFDVKLGNAIYTNIEIVSFEWLEPHNMKIVTKNGRVDLKGVCYEGEGVRLILQGNDAGIKNIYPNPVEDDFSIEYSLNETGMTEMYIIDYLGNRLKEVFIENKEYGVYYLNINISDMTNGAYFLVLQTPNEIYSKPLLKKK